MGHSSMAPAFVELRPWNEGRLVGAKRALKQQQVWAIRFWLDQHRRLRDRAVFDFAIDSKLRGCDVVGVRIGDVVSGGRVRDRAVIVQQKTRRPVQFELMDTARKTMRAWLERRGGTLNDFVFPSRNDYMAHMSTRQYARLVHEWVVGIGLPPQDYGTLRSGERRLQSSTRRRAICVPFKSCSERSSEPVVGSCPAARLKLGRLRNGGFRVPDGGKRSLASLAARTAKSRSQELSRSLALPKTEHSSIAIRT